MKKLFLPLALLLLACVPIHAQETASPAGHWDGSILVPGAPIEINVDLDGGCRWSLDR